VILNLALQSLHAGLVQDVVEFRLDRFKLRCQVCQDVRFQFKLSLLLTIVNVSQSLGPQLELLDRCLRIRLRAELDGCVTFITSNKSSSLDPGSQR
jgi:hypothetical protein